LDQPALYFHVVILSPDGITPSSDGALNITQKLAVNVAGSGTAVVECDWPNAQ
jgi:hypothetical protein